MSVRYVNGVSNGIAALRSDHGAWRASEFNEAMEQADINFIGREVFVHGRELVAEVAQRFPAVFADYDQMEKHDGE